MNGKLLSLKSVEDLQYLIDNRIQESEKLDYKQELDKNNQEIAKDISSFANTDGGIIIYGIKEENGFPIELKPFKENNQRERILDVCRTVLKREYEPDIKLIEAENNKIFLVVYIFRSSFCPHQIISKGKYQYTCYKRFGAESIPMTIEDIEAQVVRNRNLSNNLENETSQRKFLFGYEKEGYFRFILRPTILWENKIDIDEAFSNYLKEFNGLLIKINKKYNITYSKFFPNFLPSNPRSYQGGLIFYEGLYDKELAYYKSEDKDCRRYIIINNNGLIEYCNASIVSQFKNEGMSFLETKYDHMLKEFYTFLLFIIYIVKKISMIDNLYLYAEIGETYNSRLWLDWRGKKFSSQTREENIKYSKILNSLEFLVNYNKIAEGFVDYFFTSFSVDWKSYYTSIHYSDLKINEVFDEYLKT